jgi:hypothetical protein
MAIFNSHVSLPEGIIVLCNHCQTQISLAKGDDHWKRRPWGTRNCLLLLAPAQRPIKQSVYGTVGEFISVHVQPQPKPRIWNEHIWCSLHFRYFPKIWVKLQCKLHSPHSDGAQNLPNQSFTQRIGATVPVVCLEVHFAKSPTNLVFSQVLSGNKTWQWKICQLVWWFSHIMIANSSWMSHLQSPCLIIRG